MPLHRGRQQLESSGGLNLVKGPGEVIQLLGRARAGMTSHSVLVLVWCRRLSRISDNMSPSVPWHKGNPLLMHTTAT